MSTREPEPLEQIDYGVNYRASGSSSLSLKVEGGMLAVALSLVALGGTLIMALLLPQLFQSMASEAVAVQTRSIAVQAATAQDRAWSAQQQATITSEQVKILEIEMAKNGLLVRRVDGH